MRQLPGKKAEADAAKDLVAKLERNKANGLHLVGTDSLKAPAPAKSKLEETSSRQAREWIERESQKHVRTGGNDGATFEEG